MRNKINCATGSTLPTDAIPTENAESYGCDACEYIKDNVIHRCSKFIGVTGKDPQSEDKFKDEHKCKDAWDIVLILEVAQTNRGQTIAIESFRNNMLKIEEQKILGFSPTTIKAIG